MEALRHRGKSTIRGVKNGHVLVGTRVTSKKLMSGDDKVIHKGHQQFKAYSK